MASDPSGSHVLQALITMSSDKGRGKILKRLEVQDDHAAFCVKFSHRVQKRNTLNTVSPHRASMCKWRAPSWEVECLKPCGTALRSARGKASHRTSVTLMGFIVRFIFLAHFFTYHPLSPLPVPSESKLRSDQFARHVWAKFALSHFVHRRAHWQEIQTGESKKRKLFSELLE